MLITVDSQTATRLLRIYGINPPVTDERFAAHHELDTGIPVTIDGVADPEFGPSIRLKISGRRSSRMCPVNEFEAQTLVAEFHAEQLLPVDPKTDRTLVHLLTKCSRLYTDSGISELHLVLYLTPQGYRTHAVYMLRTRTVSIKKRLSPNAHDAGAVFAWRRTAKPPTQRKRT
jgi:hypothetical protein